MSSKFYTLIALLTLFGHVQAGHANSHSTTVHTALTEFDACLPLADGSVLAGSTGGLLQIDSSGKLRSISTSLDGLPGTRIHSLKESSDGIWVGTDRGAARIVLAEGTKKQGVTSPLRILESFTSSPIRDILVDETSVVFATWGQGLQRWKNHVLSDIYVGQTQAARRVTSVAKIDGHYYWTTAGSGLWHNRESKPRQSDSFPANALLWSIGQAPGKAALISGQNGVFSLRGHAKNENLHSVRAIDMVAPETIVASFGGGLRNLKGRRHETLPTDGFVRIVRTAHGVSCMGSENSLWIRRKNAVNWTEIELTSSLPDNDIAAFVSDGRQSYIGTFDHGVVSLTDTTFTALAVKHDPHVNALALDKSDNSLWIATSSELVHVRGKRVIRYTKRSGLPSRHVMSLFALASGGVLVGTAHGAAIVKDGMAKPLGGKAGIRTGNVWAVAQSKNGDNWLGTTRGLFRVRRGRIARYRVISGELPDDWVMALALADDGIFVGTYKAGVVRLKTTGDKVVVTQLGKGWVNPGGLHWDGKRLRAATMHGAFTGNGISTDWKRETKVLGMDTTVFVPSADGGQWVVTRNGLSHQREKGTL